LYDPYVSMAFLQHLVLTTPSSQYLLKQA
jgi:hypothetical protein